MRQYSLYKRVENILSTKALLYYFSKYISKKNLYLRACDDNIIL